MLKIDEKIDEKTLFIQWTTLLARSNFVKMATKECSFCQPAVRLGPISE